MAVNRKKFSRSGEAGNAVIYVLLVIVLFAALTFIVSRQKSGEQSIVGEQSTNVEAAQIIQVSNQVKQAVDQMMYSGSKISDFDFCLPANACYGAGSNIHKIFHPEGGGVIMPVLPSDAVKQINATPPAGWYMAAFNNVEWTPTTGVDVILVAHQISQSVCAKIDETLTGSATIPAITAPLVAYLIARNDADGAVQNGNVANADLDATVCPLCDSHPSLCVSDGTVYSFYNVIEQQ